MRRVIGVNSLLQYLESVQCPMTEEKVNELIAGKQIPHSRPLNRLLLFDLDHIDSWLRERRDDG